MSSQKPTKRYSCSRCQSKKIRCNRAEPRCDRCTASGADCIYPPRKTPVRRCACGIGDKNALSKILARLDRLERHCQLNPDQHEYGIQHGGWRDEDEDEDMSGTFSSLSSDMRAPVESRSPLLGPSFTPIPSYSHSTAAATTRELWNRIKDPATRPRLISDALCHLRGVEATFFGNQALIDAIEAFIDGPGALHTSAYQPEVVQAGTGTPTISKEVARECVHEYFALYQFPGFRVPLDKTFLLSIPDLLENPHVQLDFPSRLIYYNVLLHGLMLGKSASTSVSGIEGEDSDVDAIAQHITRTCVDLAERWLDETQATATAAAPSQADMLAACSVVSIGLEAGNIEFCWEMLRHTCSIARALGYFHIDAAPQYSATESEKVEKNRKRFEFWHLLRTDCMFRLLLGKPAVIRKGEWAVNFPDSPGIIASEKGEDGDDGTRMIEIHFLASMRQTLVMLRYLDHIEGPDGIDEETIDALIAETETSMALWRPDELLGSKANRIDSLLSLDMLLGSYKTLIILDQARQNRNRSRDHNRYSGLSSYTVKIARRSLQALQAAMHSAGYEYARWGVSLVFLHQFIPLLILCIDVTNRKGHDGYDTPHRKEDLALLAWAKVFVAQTLARRTEWRSVAHMMETMISACEAT
ncbi:hypothetical protein BDW67DRAFT_180768 [Aspergillus spinulosporus]